MLQGQKGWGVTYTSTQICALRGTTVEINCTYEYPYPAEVTQSFWFTKQRNDVFVDLQSDPAYSSRVKYHCVGKRCMLRITDLRKSDSDVYMFRFVTNQREGKYTGSPGVTLSVTGNIFVWVFINSARWLHLCVFLCVHMLTVESKMKTCVCYSRIQSSGWAHLVHHWSVTAVVIWQEIQATYGSSIERTFQGSRSIMK